LTSRLAALTLKSIGCPEWARAAPTNQLPCCIAGNSTLRPAPSLLAASSFFFLDGESSDHLPTEAQICVSFANALRPGESRLPNFFASATLRPSAAALQAGVAGLNPVLPTGHPWLDESARRVSHPGAGS